MRGRPVARWCAAGLLLVCGAVTGCGNTELDAAQKDNARLRSELESARRAAPAPGAGEQERQLQQDNVALRQRLAGMDRLRDALALRQKEYERLRGRLQKLVDAKRLRIEFRNGRLALALADDVLFDTGSAGLSGAGKEGLGEVASALREVPKRRFRIEGHTDNVLVKRGGKYKDNWELSQARSLVVLRYLVAQGLDEERLSTGGHSDTEPVESNAAEEGRRANRRTEIILDPRLDDLPLDLDRK